MRRSGLRGRTGLDTLLYKADRLGFCSRYGRETLRKLVVEHGVSHETIRAVIHWVVGQG